MLGSMVHGAETQEEEVLKMLVLNDLAKIHGIKLETLRDELFERMHVFDWSRNINSMGAFGVFGPNQFRDVYQSLTRPAANSRLHFAGETISTTHGWVAGALESADRVFEQLWCSHGLQQSEPDMDTWVRRLDSLNKEWCARTGVPREALTKQVILK
ncbi:unnamed protein product [Rhizoctonia solani]|uniref:Amine oxidase domain-containing protein n=1 Tax=Rhizoctonia solani TaxID=456999 RepID=A0A8H3BTN1_9AGAM|nr:unnamed protein product [Rhizoctonia solani]